MKGTIDKGVLFKLKRTAYGRKIPKLVPRFCRKLPRAMHLSTFFTHVENVNMQIQKRLNPCNCQQVQMMCLYDGDITLINHVWMRFPTGPHQCIHYFLLEIFQLRYIVIFTIKEAFKPSKRN